SKNFYEKVFDFSFENYGSSQNNYFYIKGINSDSIKATLVEDKIPCVINTFKVENIVETLKKVKLNGGEILLNKTSIPSVGFIAYFKDLDGNIFSVAESSKLAN
nr:hypothetical protein [Patescibacteria group bacterium]